MTICQLNLPLSLPIIGQIVVNTELTNRDIERMKHQRITTIYIIKMPESPVMTWDGTGQRPRWIKWWLEEGGSLEQIKALI